VRLRWALALAFLTLSLIQLVVVVPLSLRSLSGLLTSQHEARVAQVMRIAAGERQRIENDVQRALDELQSSEALALAVRAITEDDPEAITHAAENLMVPRGLQVLSLLDSDARTISSGHLPARRGEANDELGALVKLKSRAFEVVSVQISTPTGLASVPAAVSFRKVGPHLFLAGGLLLDARRAQELAQLTLARVEILNGAQTIATAGAISRNHTDRAFALGETTVRLLISRDDLDATRVAVMRSFFLLAALGFMLSIGFGVAASRRLTRPLEALTAAALQIARGVPGAQVRSPQATQEIQQFIDVFNTMTSDLKTATNRLVSSERIAAWQEVAKRLAHEIKNPLTPIRMSLETLLAASQRGQLDERFRALFTTSASAVLEEVLRLNRIVDEFSQFARLPKPRLEQLELSQLLHSLISLYPREAGQQHTGALIEAHLSQDIWVMGDKDLLTQVVVNLIKNAQEAMAQKSGAIVLRLSIRGPLAQLEIEDEGPGIPDGLRDRLFEPYITTKPQGTGLGLAIALRIMQEHQGTISAAAGSKGGSTFIVTLPRAARPAEITL
jgi:two-component system, NtrC family, nitrogen regulation sensor histidine kinase NtrY